MSNQVKLRAYEQEDNTFLHGLVNDPNIMDFWFTEAHQPKALMDDMYQKNKNNDNMRSFILAKGEEQLGLVQLVDIDYVHRKAEFTIMIDPAQQGNGYAFKATRLAMDYAFNTLNLHKLYLFVDEINEKAMHVYETCGYKHVATLEEEYFVNGTYHNAVIMNIFQRDYRKMIKQAEKE